MKTNLLILLLVQILCLHLSPLEAQEQFFQSKICLASPTHIANSCLRPPDQNLNALLKTTDEVDSALCEKSISSDLCKDALARYPFLKDRMKSCRTDSKCGENTRSVRAQMKEGCHRGLLEAKNTFEQEISDTVQNADQILDEWKRGFSEIFEHLPDLNFQNLAQTYLQNLPTQTRAKISELFLESEKYQCFDLEGRFAYLCYQMAIHGESTISSLSISSVSKNIVSSIVLPGKIKQKIAKSASAPPVGLAKLETEFGGKVEIVKSIGANGKYAIFTIKDPLGGKVMGTLDLEYNKKKKTLNIGYIRATKDYQSMGVSETLLQQALEEFPNVDKIYTESLTETNKEIVLAAKSKGKSTIEALKETPAYKIRKKFGFTEINPASIDEGTFAFETTKGP